VKEGDRVTAGQVLARLDPIQAAAAAEGADAALSAIETDTRSAAAQVRSTEALLEEARSRRVEAAAALERAQQLRDAGLLPASEFDRIVAMAAAARAQEASAVSAVEKNELSRTSSQRRAEQARAERARVRDQLSKTTITAPISGTITRLDVELGEMVVMGVQNQPGTILMTISDLSTINAEVKVAEADVMRLAVGQPANVTLEALTGQRFAGRVIEIGASALPQIGAQSAREFRVKIELDRSDIPLRPGLTCDAEIVAADKRNILVVPLQAVAIRDGKPGVFTVLDDRARFTPVTTGIIGGLQIEIEGVAEGAEIVSGSIQALRDLQDGAPVRRAQTRR
jgi:HlyD family secretion protein